MTGSKAAFFELNDYVIGTVKFGDGSAETLELVHGDLCGPITPATHDGRKYFILPVDDCSGSCGCSF